MYHPTDPSPAEFAAGYEDKDAFEFIEPSDTVSLEDAKGFPCDLEDPVRSATELKGAREVDGVDCGPAGCC